MECDGRDQLHSGPSATGGHVSVCSGFYTHMHICVYIILHSSKCSLRDGSKIVSFSGTVVDCRISYMGLAVLEQTGILLGLLHLLGRAS